MQESTDYPPGENLFAPIRWTAWDTPLRIAIHPKVADDATEFPRLVLVCLGNGWMRITSTRRPLTAVSTAIRVAREHDTSVVSALISAPRPRMGAVCGSLFKRPQLEGYRYRGHGIFEALDVPQALSVLAQTIRVEPPPAPPAVAKTDATATATTPPSPSIEHKEPQMTDNTPAHKPSMDGLIPVFVGRIGGVEQHVCNARDLHAFLEVGRDFTNWIKDRIEKYQFVENQDFTIDSPNLANQRSGRGGDRRSVTYHLTLDMAKELSMVENNDKGRMARRYFIECERKALGMAAAGATQSLPQEVEDACETRAWRLAEEWHSMGMALLGPTPRPENIETLWLAAGVVKARTKERLVALTHGMVKKGHGATSVSSWVLNWQPPGYSTWNQVSWH